jgi:hypothetical protein
MEVVVYWSNFDLDAVVRELAALRYENAYDYEDGKRH